MAARTAHPGTTIRRARLRAGLPLRQLAALLGVSASYLSHIENGRRVPSPRFLENVAGHLGLDPEALLAASGKLDPQTTRYLRRHPAAIRLLQRIARLRLGPEQIAELEQAVQPVRKRLTEYPTSAYALTSRPLSDTLNQEANPCPSLPLRP